MVARTRPSQAATRSGSRHVYNCRARAPRQIPCGSQRRAAPSIAARAALPRSDTVPRDDVDLDAGFLQRPQHAGVIGAVRTRAVRTSAVRREGE